MLSTVTITGADDSIRGSELAALSEEFPFVEWGILFSHSQQGLRRFPTLAWVKELPAGLRYSAHFCGKYVRETVLEGNNKWVEWLEHSFPVNFQRIQLNFHGQFHKANSQFVPMLQYYAKTNFILQCDGVNDGAVRNVVGDCFNVSPLFDTSGGAGLVPPSWPVSWPGVYCGYAGGLGPDIIAIELPKIADRTQPAQPFWIDMERNVRSEDDWQFDLTKVRTVLDYCSAYVAV
jgi:hypothetical protein